MPYVQKENWKKIIELSNSLNSNFEDNYNLKTQNIALYGAGRCGKVALAYLRNQGYNVVCFIDNSPEKQGLEIEGLQVVSINNPIIKTIDLILISIRGMEPIKDLPIKNMSFDTWYVIKNIEKYEFIQNNILHDDKSRQTLNGILLSIITKDNKYYADIMEFNQYFCLPQFRNNYNEYFVDVGSFVGDSIEKFIWANDGIFKKIIAFEPGKKQYKASEKRVLRLIDEWALDPETISIINLTIGSKEDFKSSDLIYNVINDYSNTRPDFIKISTLDTQLENTLVTFIKADIEGMEMEMLKGAKQTILKNKPKLAVCVYHNITDLIEIIDFLHTLVPDYTMSLGHHSHVFSETVLYCWIKS